MLWALYELLAICALCAVVGLRGDANGWPAGRVAADLGEEKAAAAPAGSVDANRGEGAGAELATAFGSMPVAIGRAVLVRHVDADADAAAVAAAAPEAVSDAWRGAGS